ncbi:MAG: DoxX family protein [Actinomycetota bacterium]
MAIETDTTARSITADRSGSVPVALLRITLGVILLVAFFDNLDKGLYSADGFEGFIDFLFSEEGNDSALGIYESFVDAVIVPLGGAYGWFQGIVELVIAVALIAGVATRVASLVAAIFFANLFLAYVGGEEWIWTYVLLFMSAVTVFLGWGGRKLGLDERIVRERGESPYGLIW